VFGKSEIADVTPKEAAQLVRGGPDPRTGPPRLTWTEVQDERAW
jgi:hypothetical protein